MFALFLFCGYICSFTLRIALHRTFYLDWPVRRRYCASIAWARPKWVTLQRHLFGKGIAKTTMTLPVDIGDEMLGVL
ncbi:hypothetical protein PENSPDRAFT_657024 [Peniophora sp. CONT]|nr:hypothetical protein PENSPDRAFT_657024 [Peniophora sp. CONT]